MAWVDTKTDLFSLKLHEDVMREILRGSGVRERLAEVSEKTVGEIETHVSSTARPRDAANYIASLLEYEADSGEMGFDFSGPYELGDRPIRIIGVPEGRGDDLSALPPLMVEARTHALTSPTGVSVGSHDGDIR